MNELVAIHHNTAVVSEEYLLTTHFTYDELRAISDGPSIETRKNIPSKTPKKRRKKT